MSKMKKCGECRELKPIYSFPDRMYELDGKGAICKICNREKRKNTPKVLKRKAKDQFNLRRVTMEDYCQMYELLRLIGYDPKKDIHQQFLDKHGLVKRKYRTSQQVNKYNYQDCKKKPEN